MIKKLFIFVLTASLSCLLFSCHKNNSGQMTELRYLDISVDTVYFAPRVSSVTVTLSNLTDNTLIFMATSIALSGQQHEVSITNADLFTQGHWTFDINPGQNKKLIIKASHGKIGSFLESIQFDVTQMDKNYARKHLGVIDLPIKIETSSRDHFVNVVGRVTDTEGNFLEGAVVFDERNREVTMTDSEGKFYFEDISPYDGYTSISVYHDNYKKQTKSRDYIGVCELTFKFRMERCDNILYPDKAVVDFGTGSISASSGYETIPVHLVASNDTSLYSFDATVIVPGPIFPIKATCHPTNGANSGNLTIHVQLDRSTGSVGEFSNTLIISTDNAGVYCIPIRYTNVE